MADEPTARPKRRVKNPETFRERAVKATAANERPGKARRLKTAGGNITRPVTSPVKRVLRKLATIQPFRFILKLLRWVGLVLVPPYLRNSWKELKLVTWPTRKQSRQLTFAVLIFAIIFGAAVAVVDYGLDKLFRNILLK